MSAPPHAFSAHEPRQNVRKHRPGTTGTAAAASLAPPPGPVLTTTAPASSYTA